MAEIAAGVPAAGRLQRDLRRPRHRPRRWSRTRRRRWSRSPAASGPAGRWPRRAAADLKRVHLELGGKAPCIVFDDADMAAAAEGIAAAGYFNAGQDCTAATRVLAGPGVHDDFVAPLTEQAKGQTVGGLGRRGRLRPAQQRQPARAGQRLHRPAARPRLGADRRRPGRRPRLLLRTDRHLGPAAGRRDGPERDLRSGHHGAAVHRRGRGARLGQRRGVRPRVVGLDHGPRSGDADGEAARLRLRLDQHPHPDRRRDAARRLQALRLRQGPVDVRLRGLHPDQARDEHLGE